MQSGAALATKDLAALRALAMSLGVEVPVADLTAEWCKAVFGLAPVPGSGPEGGPAAGVWREDDDQ